MPPRLIYSDSSPVFVILTRTGKKLLGHQLGPAITPLSDCRHYSDEIQIWGYQLGPLDLRLTLRPPYDYISNALISSIMLTAGLQCDASIKSFGKGSVETLGPIDRIYHIKSQYSDLGQMKYINRH